MICSKGKRLHYDLIKVMCDFTSYYLYVCIMYIPLYQYYVQQYIPLTLRFIVHQSDMMDLLNSCISFDCIYYKLFLSCRS